MTEPRHTPRTRGAGASGPCGVRALRAPTVTDTARRATRTSASGVSPAPLIAVAALVATALGVGLWLMRAAPASQAAELTLLAAAVTRPTCETIVQDFTRDTGIRVNVQYGGSGALLAGVASGGPGDLLLAADESYIDAARTRGLAGESRTLAPLAGVIAVAPGNPRNVRSLDDLARVAYALPNPETAAIGAVLQRELPPERWAALLAGARVVKPTVTDVANDVRLGVVDAGLVWDATVRQYGGTLEAVRDADLDRCRGSMQIALLTTAKRPDVARRLLDYFADPQRGGRRLTELGFSPTAPPPLNAAEPTMAGAPAATP